MVCSSGSCGHLTRSISEMKAHVADENSRLERVSRASAAGPSRRTELVADPWVAPLPVPGP